MTNDLQQAAMFLERMQPHLDSGMSFEDAGKAVLDRDVKMVNKVLPDSDLKNLARNTMARSIWNSVNVA